MSDGRRGRISIVGSLSWYLQTIQVVKIILDAMMLCAPGLGVRLWLGLFF